MISTNQPGNTSFLVEGDGKAAWVRDDGAPGHEGAMHVLRPEVASQADVVLAGS